MSTRYPALPAWLAGGSCLLALGWLLPNHYPPWSTFHMDAWVALVLLLAGAVVVVRTPARFGWRGLPLIAAVVVLIPILQCLLGLINSPGTAWISSAYLLGLLLAILVGSQWESDHAGQLGDALFLAIGAAAFISVGLQLTQWLYLDVTEYWIMADNYNRPFANFGQPNQLATFHIWALLGLVWAYLRRWIGPAVGIAAALFLLLGLVLAVSRTSWIAVGMLVAGSWYWRRLWPTKGFAPTVTALALVFAGGVLSARIVQQYLLGGVPTMPRQLTRLVVREENRPAIWSMFLDAVAQRPWLGYGWNEITQAQLTVAERHTPKFGIFAHSHNLILDLVLWCGIPLGLAIAIWLGWWLWQQLQTVSSAETAILLAVLLVVGNHAMLELPLHHAYLLLPAGLVAGMLDTRSHGRVILATSRAWMVALWSVAACVLGLVIADYLRVEPQYQQLRYEWANIKGPRAVPPDVVLLTQFPDFVRLVQTEPKASMDPASLQWMREATAESPWPAHLQKLAQALALNGQPDESAHWLRLLCKVSATEQCEAAQRSWKRLAAQSPPLAAVQWP